MYRYQNVRPELFTEDGVKTLTAIRRQVAKALEVAGAVRASEAWRDAPTGDSWVRLAAIDYLVEEGELYERTDPTWVLSQDRVFVRGPRG